MVFNGGTHILPMSIAALGTFALCAAIARRDWRPLAFVAAFGAAGLAYSAPKLIPVVQYVGGDYFWDTRNPTEKPDRVTLDILRADLPRSHPGRRLAPADAAARLARVRQLHRTRIRDRARRRVAVRAPRQPASPKRRSAKAGERRRLVSDCRWPSPPSCCSCCRSVNSAPTRPPCCRSTCRCSRVSGFQAATRSRSCSSPH